MCIYRLRLCTIDAACRRGVHIDGGILKAMFKTQTKHSEFAGELTDVCMSYACTGSGLHKSIWNVGYEKHAQHLVAFRLPLLGLHVSISVELCMHANRR